MTNRGFYLNTTYSLAAFLEQQLGLQRGTHFRFSHAITSYQVLTLWLVINPAFTKRVMGMSKELSQAARLEKGKFIRVVWGSDGTVELQIPKPYDLCQSPKVGGLPTLRGVKTAVGFDTVNQAAYVDFANPITGHGLIASPTGTGKSNIARVLAYRLAMQNSADKVNFLLFDVADDGLAWDGFENIPHLIHGIIADTQTALSAMDWLIEELETRSKERRELPRLVVLVDEFAELSRHASFVESCARLAQRGRKRGINLVLCTQRPTKDSMGSMNITANLGLRIVGKVATSQEAAWSTGLSASGAELLTGPGDMLLVKAGQIQRMATPLLTDEDLAKLPRNGNGYEHEFDIPEAFYDEDVDESNVGRPRDPLDMAQMALAVAIPDISQRSLTRRFSIGFGKAKRVLEQALQLRAELDRLGCEIGYRDSKGRLLKLRAG